MFVEVRTYMIRCGKIREYLALYEEYGRALHERILGNPLGVFTVEFGDLDRIVFMNGYDSLEERGLRRAQLYGNPEWGAYTDRVKALIMTQSNELLVRHGGANDPK